MYMGEQHLHIICFDVPYPVDYGGVFDLFFKIKYLHKAGIKIHLHCFEYGREKQPELDKYCIEVKYYQRVAPFKCLFYPVPYIVSSRASRDLLANLEKDRHPILMEGMHCTYFLHKGNLPKQRCFVRLPNVEYLYYRRLAETTTSLFKKWYYRREARQLLRYEKDLADKAKFWTISQKDCDLFRNELGYREISNLPLFLQEYQPEWRNINGGFCLYHGNLAVDENEFAAIWLLEKVFSEVKIPFVIAGKNPSKKLVALAHAQLHTCLVSNPGNPEMEDLIRKAQIHILPSFNSTGIKLKLINALYHGRHCIVNTSAVEGSGLEDCCIIANTCRSIKDEVKRYFGLPFTREAYNQRIARLNATFNNSKNAQLMIESIFGNRDDLSRK